MSASITSYNLELASEAFKSERIASLERQLSNTKAALRASTELLRDWQLDGTQEWCAERIENQIAANRRLLGGQ